jgi:hypothetical protein
MREARAEGYLPLSFPLALPLPITLPLSAPLWFPSSLCAWVGSLAGGTGVLGVVVGVAAGAGGADVGAAAGAGPLGFFDFGVVCDAAVVVLEWVCAGRCVGCDVAAVDFELRFAWLVE